jgi:6-phosphofructokinase 1
MKRIGVLTSGGDAPGMNACIRAVVRTGIVRGLDIVGVRRGFQGMLDGDFVPMNLRSVSNTIQTGGTILKTGRCQAFFERAERARAVARAQEAGLEGIVAIGGDGTFHGAHYVVQETGFPMVGAPGTIDNDVFGTDFTIGFDTAVNTALEAIDRIRDTAAAHDRVFLVEVMGRSAGFIAAASGLAGGAEHLLIPETPTTVQHICAELEDGLKRGKTSQIIIVAEGEEQGGAFEVAKKMQACLTTPLDLRVCILGHVQRGGSPTASDRILASKLGAAALEALSQGASDVMVGEVGGQLVRTPLPDTWEKKKPVDPDMLRLVEVLAR